LKPCIKIKSINNFPEKSQFDFSGKSNLEDMKLIFTFILTVLMCSSSFLFAGNPDRQGEAGAYELLMNPWARSAGWHTMSTSLVSGVNALRINPAGLGNINSLEVALGSARYLIPSGVSFSGLGLAKRLSSHGVMGISLMSVNTGEIRRTTTESPEGTGATYKPTLLNIGVSYAHDFITDKDAPENRIRVGVLVRTVTEAISDASATGVGLDAGVQYVSGDRGEFKFGVSLRNLGSKMKFSGSGLGLVNAGEIRKDVQAASFDMPSLLNIGASYDFYFADLHRITLLGNFTANSYSRDEIGGGLEYSFNDRFMLRGAYKYDNRFGVDAIKGKVNNAYTGLSFGATFQFDVLKNEDDEGNVTSITKMAVDYAYRTSNPFSGTHNLTLSVKI